MRQNLADFLHRADEIIPDLTLGELICVHQKFDFELNRQLNISPISDTLDLRSCHIRRSQSLDFILKSDDIPENSDGGML